MPSSKWISTVADRPFLSLEESARVAGHARWAEARLFEALGAWVQAEPDPAAKVLWAMQSAMHGHHATGWKARQPRVAHLDADALVAPAGDGAVAVLGALAVAHDTVLRLAGVDLVTALLVAAYRCRVEDAHPLADGPVVRWVMEVVAAEEDARRRAAALLASRLGAVPPAEAVGPLLGLH